MLQFVDCAPLAQLDRASGYEPEGREFESLRARHSFQHLTARAVTAEKQSVRVLVLLLYFLLAPLSHAQTFRVPFRSVNGMILLDGQVNDKPAALLLDTGADFTLITPEAAGLAAKLDPLKATKTTGANGEYVKGRVDLRLAERHWIERAVLVMDLSEASKRLGTRIDGFIGQDVLREFSAARIDYKASVIEFEK